MKLIAGLGNPGRQYEKTRHNLGFRTIDRLADTLDIKVIKSKHKALTGDKNVGGEKIMLVKPMTFMNLSGQSIKEIMDYYNIPENDIVVVYDDCALPVGSVRVRKSGSDGGHNGMKSIISSIGTQNFVRVRIGIGEKPDGWDLADYVLSVFSSDEKPEIEKAVNDAADCIQMILKIGVNEAMNKYNKRMHSQPAQQQDKDTKKAGEPGEKND